jgi:hypothetical protein
VELHAITETAILVLAAQQVWAIKSIAIPATRTAPAQVAQVSAIMLKAAPSAGESLPDLESPE